MNHPNEFDPEVAAAIDLLYAAKKGFSQYEESLIFSLYVTSPDGSNPEFDMSETNRIRVCYHNMEKLAGGEKVDVRLFLSSSSNKIVGATRQLMGSLNQVRLEEQEVRDWMPIETSRVLEVDFLKP